jgi:hypothetical protein
VLLWIMSGLHLSSLTDIDQRWKRTDALIVVVPVRPPVTHQFQ